ncbi:arsenate reductase ArsC [candidate division KSB1 bacterium]|nr:arsenate reductase ArsC [candidate division KSB1 bacterium]
MKTVLVICTGNSARSQMMEGLLNHFGNGKVQAHSAGTRPSTINPFAIEAMTEIGIDISTHYSKSIDEFSNQTFDVVLTVCDSARESCPFFPGEKIIHKSFTDPAALEGSDQKKLKLFRKVRDEEMEWVEDFLKK